MKWWSVILKIRDLRQQCRLRFHFMMAASRKPLAYLIINNALLRGGFLSRHRYIVHHWLTTNGHALTRSMVIISSISICYRSLPAAMKYRYKRMAISLKQNAIDDWRALESCNFTNIKRGQPWKLANKNVKVEYIVIMARACKKWRPLPILLSYLFIVGYNMRRRWEQAKASFIWAVVSYSCHLLLDGMHLKMAMTYVVYSD